MDRIYDPEYELKARTFNATNVCNGSNHDRNFRTTLVFWLRPERAASCDFVDRFTAPTWIKRSSSKLARIDGSESKSNSEGSSSSRCTAIASLMFSTNSSSDFACVTTGRPMHSAT